jgi:hypothetical protein
MESSSLVIHLQSPVSLIDIIQAYIRIVFKITKRTSLIPIRANPSHLQRYQAISEHSDNQTVPSINVD